MADPTKAVVASKKAAVVANKHDHDDDPDEADFDLGPTPAAATHAASSSSAPSPQPAVARQSSSNALSSSSAASATNSSAPQPAAHRRLISEQGLDWAAAPANAYLTAKWALDKLSVDIGDEAVHEVGAGPAGSLPLGGVRASTSLTPKSAAKLFPPPPAQISLASLAAMAELGSPRPPPTPQNGNDAPAVLAFPDGHRPAAIATSPLSSPGGGLDLKEAPTPQSASASESKKPKRANSTPLHTPLEILRQLHHTIDFETLCRCTNPSDALTFPASGPDRVESEPELRRIFVEGMMYIAQDKLTEADRILTTGTDLAQTSAKRKGANAGNRQWMGAFCISLGFVSFARGSHKAERAERCYAKGLEYWTRVLGRGSPKMSLLLDDLACIYMVRQKYDDTLDALDALASILMGGDSLDVGLMNNAKLSNVLWRMGLAHAEQDHNLDAFRYFEKAVATAPHGSRAQLQALLVYCRFLKKCRAPDDFTTPEALRERVEELSRHCDLITQALVVPVPPPTTRPRS